MLDTTSATSLTESKLRLGADPPSRSLSSSNSVSNISEAADNGLVVDDLARKIDCVFPLENISPPACKGEIGVVMTGIFELDFV